jgi:hypothetical protein
MQQNRDQARSPSSARGFELEAAGAGSGYRRVFDAVARQHLKQMGWTPTVSDPTIWLQTGMLRSNFVARYCCKTENRTRQTGIPGMSVKRR